MLIGIDASRAASERRTGTETYSLHLIQALLALGTTHRFRLYFNAEPPADLFPGPVDWRVMPFPRLWTHVRLSWEMLLMPPDVLFVPAHVLPLVHPRQSVVTVHDLGYEYYPQAHTLFQNLYLRWSTRYNARAAAHILADSEATRGDLVRLYGADPAKITVAYPGRDEALSPVADPAPLAAVRARYGIPGPYLLYVGTLQPRKNLVRLVQAFARAAPRLDPALHLVLAGKPGWLSEEIEAEARRTDLMGRVLLPGYVPRTDLAALLSGALAFVYPSLYEGFGLPVLEAMSCGTPVVCSSRSSLPEVAGEAALLVDPADVGAWVEALVRIASDEGLRRDLAVRGLSQAQRFSWARCARQAIEVIEGIARD